MKNNGKLYLAYGSNMDLAQMARRCPDAHLVGVTEIRDWELLFKGSKTGCYATIEPCREQTVPALVWSISEADERNLDRYEGFPTFYQKQDIEVEMPGGSVTAMAYTMDPSRPLGLPTIHYFDILDEAYDLFHFDKNILEQALHESGNE